MKTRIAHALFILAYVAVAIFLLLTGAPIASAFTLNIANDTDNLARVMLYESGQNVRWFYCPANTSVAIQLPNSTDIQSELARRYGGGDGMTWVGEATNYTATSTTDQSVLVCDFKRDDGTSVRWQHFTPPSTSGGGSGSVLTSDEMETFKLGFWFVVSCGLFIVIIGVARMISSQDHRP